MSKERIYLVKASGDPFLVKATSKGKAKNFIKKQLVKNFVDGLDMKAEVASQDELIVFTKDGVLVKDAQ